MTTTRKIILAITLAIIIVAAVAAQNVVILSQHMTYFVLWDSQHMTPAAVCYNLKASDFRGSINSKPRYFKMDVNLPPPHVRNGDYRHTQFEKGHLCPAGDRDSRKDWLKDTYCTSNILPMYPQLNSGAWKETELWCRRAAALGHVLRIACGAKYAQDQHNRLYVGRSAVPDSVWKIARCTIHDGEVISWMIPNDTVWRREAECRRFVLHDCPEVKRVVENWIGQ